MSCYLWVSQLCSSAERNLLRVMKQGLKILSQRRRKINPFWKLHEQYHKQLLAGSSLTFPGRAFNLWCISQFFFGCETAILKKKKKIITLVKLYRFYLQGARGHKHTFLLWTLQGTRCSWKLGVHDGHLVRLHFQVWWNPCSVTYSMVSGKCFGTENSSADGCGYYRQRWRGWRVGKEGTGGVIRRHSLWSMNLLSPRLQENEEWAVVVVDFMC